MSQPPILSVVIPTHNRSDLLMKNLEALTIQHYPAQAFEVIVVADSCQDDTVERVTAYIPQAPYALHLLSHNAGSASATRNLGASQAQGKFLLFIDDDIVPQPQLIQSHLEAQQPNGIVLGYSRPVMPDQPSWWQQDAYRWWEDRFREMRQPGHRFTYKDFFSGNVSMSTDLFRQQGAFDESITGRLEDYELGLRLIKARVRFRHVSSAVGDHHDHTDLLLWVRRIRKEGIAHIQIGQRHPELRTSLFNFKKIKNRQMRLLHNFAFHHPDWGDQWEWLLFRQAALYEQLHLRKKWQRTLRLLRHYNYWRGVAMTIKSLPAFNNWLQEAPLTPTVASNAPTVDMAAFPAPSLLQEILEQATETGLRLAIEGFEVTAIPPQPGAEPLREEHLRHTLREAARKDFVPAMALPLIRNLVKEGRYDYKIC